MVCTSRVGAGRALAALSVVAVAALAGCGSSDPSTSSTTTSSSVPSNGSSTTSSSTTTTAATGKVVEIAVVGGKVTGGVERVDIDLGDRVTIRVTSDVDEELHLHGYDLKEDLTAGTPVELTFTADIPGVFEAELEHSGLKVVELQVA
jgi:heme/copper-type cytochrome/quinol oxidase subunit 2